MTSPFTENEVEFLSVFLDKARHHIGGLRNCIAATYAARGVAEGHAAGLVAALADAQHLMHSLGSNLNYSGQGALVDRLHDTHDMATVIQHEIKENHTASWHLELVHTVANNIRTMSGHAREISTRVDKTQETAPRTTVADRSSRRLAAWAARVLPPGHRVRYREEFQAELHDLRDQPAWRQVNHGLRLLTRAVTLRRALRAAEPALERTR